MTWWHYLTLVNIYLVLFYGFYSLMLKRGTFFQLNRLYLIAAVFFSFAIPVMQADWVKDLFITQQVQYKIYSSPVFIYQFKPLQETGISIGEIVLIAYAAGVVCLSARFISQLFKLKMAMSNPETSEAYSFFGNVTIGDDLKTNKSINAHELVHARQWHSLDVVLVEVVMIVNWFNPIVYLYRLAVKHLHEFIADRQVLKSGIDKSDYAMLLVSQAFETPVHHLVNTFFNKSLLKQRIIMLNKAGSGRIMLIKYCLIAPLFILMLILSSATVNNSKSVYFINKKAAQVFSIPQPLVDQVRNHWGDKTFTNKNMRNGEIMPVADTPRKNKTRVYTSVERTPEFPGGMDAFYDFLGKNIKYPQKMRENNIQGRVIITFVVEKDGSLTGARVVRGIQKDGDDETMRVLKLSPKWEPGMQKGKPVRVQYTVPIAFTLSDEPQSKKRKMGMVNGKRSSLTFASTVISVRMNDTTKYVAHVRIASPDTANTCSKPIYFLDGKEIADIREIDPKNIERISVLRDKSAVSLYGAKGANGVILIVTKPSQAKS